MLDARIRDAGNPADPAQQLVGVGEVRGLVRAADLQVDRRGRAEIQDLADDVGRQEREAQAGKQPRQLLAQRLDMLGRRPVVFLQLDLDIAILRADHAGVVVGHVDAGDRHADVVGDGLDFLRRNDLADRLLHVGELVGGFLDAGSDLGADMHQDVAGIDRGEEIAPEERHQQERHGDEAQEADHEGRPVRQRHREQAAIAAANALEPRLEAALETHQRIAGRRRPPFVMGMRLQADSSPWSAPACATG